MDGSPESTRLERIAAVLRRHGVEFIVIGGEAAAIHGSPLPTFDTDLCYRRSADNLRRLAGALREIGVTLRGAPPDLPFRVDELALGLGSNFTFSTPLGDLDLLGYVEPFGGFDQIAPRCVTVPIPGGELRVISLDDLIRIKEHIGRAKDRAALVQLLAIRELREAGEGPGGAAGT